MMDAGMRAALETTLFFAGMPVLLGVLAVAVAWIATRWKPAAEWWLFAPLGQVLQRLRGVVSRTGPSRPDAFQHSR